MISEGVGNMQGKVSEEGIKTVISFSLTDPEVSVCQGLQLPGNKLQTLHIILTQIPLEVTNHHPIKKREMCRISRAASSFAPVQESRSLSTL